MMVVIRIMHVIILLSEEKFLIGKAKAQIRNCYLLIALGTTDTDSDKTKSCFQATLSLSPSESLPWTQVSVLGMFYRSWAVGEGHGISVRNIHVGEYLMYYLSPSVFL